MFLFVLICYRPKKHTLFFPCLFSLQLDLMEGNLLLGLFFIPMRYCRKTFKTFDLICSSLMSLVGFLVNLFPNRALSTWFYWPICFFVNIQYVVSYAKDTVLKAIFQIYVFMFFSEDSGKYGWRLEVMRKAVYTTPFFVSSNILCPPSRHFAVKEAEKGP